MGSPKYLTGDKASIDQFVDKFDVRDTSSSPTNGFADTLRADVPLRLRWYGKDTRRPSRDDLQELTIREG